ncbi:MAG: preprotein translocase subunit YajC [Planctomycetaceae bacterium]|nr:preprotein translocase subunit YajC [Planctomycetaceae bacterium]|tara:strand:- start:1649 stop:2059 length:411 start_codon:yes stop_codon:yes gene_type:complete
MYYQIQMIAGSIQYLLIGQENVGDPADPAGSGNTPFLLMILAFMVFMFMFSGKGAKKRKQKRNQMITSISKYTEVITIGGICGTVVDIEMETATDDTDPIPTHFLLELDAGSGSRLRVVAEAVGRIVDNAEDEVYS